MRSRDDIVAKMQKDKGSIFGGDVLIEYLDWERVKPFLKEGTPEETWTGADAGDFAGFGGPTNKKLPLDPADTDFIRKSMEVYAAFGWDKISDHRGLSAGRTIEKMKDWLWLLEDEEGIYWCNTDDLYPQYGAPVLKRICEKYGFPIPDEDSIRNMAEGNPCTPGCDMGCGK